MVYRQVFGKARVALEFRPSPLFRFGNRHREHHGQLRHFWEPSAVVFLVAYKGEVHRESQQMLGLFNDWCSGWWRTAANRPCGLR